MPPKAQPPSILRFGAFEVDLCSGELRKKGVRLKIQEQPFQVLRLLLNHPGEVVTREELRSEIWSADTFVDFDNSLNAAINKLREALGDSAENSRFVETLPKRGYRFNPPVSIDGAVSGGNVRTPRRTWKIAVSGIALVALVGTIATLLVLKRHPPTPGGAIQEHQLTHNPAENSVGESAISRDGRYLAFQDKRGLHISAIDSGEEHDVSLPDDLRKQLFTISWFPDGEKLLIGTRSGELWAVSILGGAPHKLQANCYRPRISPDGAKIAFVSSGLWTMGVNGENPRKILAVDSGHIFVPEWSPTGRRIAVGIQEPNGAEVTIRTVAPDGGNPLVVLKSPLMNDQVGFIWSTDRRLIFVRGDAASESSFNLWYIAVDPDSGIASGEPLQLTHWDGLVPLLSGLSQDGKRLVLLKVHSWIDVFVGELQEHGTRLEKPANMTSNDSLNYPNGWFLDGRSLLISSNKTDGRYQIYRQRLHQEPAEAVISSNDDTGSAELTPDRAWILYWASTHASGIAAPRASLMRTPVVGGASERILEARVEAGTAFHCATQANTSCVLSRLDKDQLVFYSLDTIKGQGTEIARTKVGEPDEWMSWALGPEGKKIAVAGSRGLDNKVRIIDLESGQQRDLTSPSFILGGMSWSADGGAVYGGAQKGNDFYLLRLDLSGKSQILLSRPEGEVIYQPHVSPDGHFLAYGQQFFESNAYLLENF